MRGRVLLVAGAALLVAPVAWATYRAAVGVPGVAVPWSARDLDCSGKVSLWEWYGAGLDYGWRPAISGGPGCMEVFALKDGTPVAVWCPSSPLCTAAR